MIRRLLASALIILACGGFFKGSSTIPYIEPSAAWTGVAGSGSCPAVDATQQVSGLLVTPSVYKAIGNIDAPENDVVETAGTYVITAGAATSNRTGIAKVRVCIEGTSVDVTTEGVNPVTGSKGFNFGLQSRTAPTGQNGFVNVIVDYYPRDGYVLRTSQVMWLNSNAAGAGYINRTSFVKWVDPVSGTDPVGNCTLTPTAGNTKATAFKTIIRGMNCVGNGGLVYVVSGATLVEDLQGCGGGICGTHTHLTTVMPEPGGLPFTISRTLRSGGAAAGLYRLTNANVKWQNFRIDFAKFEQVYVDGSLILSNFYSYDSNGLRGGKFGYQGIDADQGTGGFTQHGVAAMLALLDGTCLQTGGCFGLLTRNVNAIITTDNFVVGIVSPTQANRGTRTFNYKVNEPYNYLTPNGAVGQTPLTIASVGAFSAGKTVITFSGSPGITATSAWTATFLSGALQGQHFGISSSTSTTITLNGDATAAVPGNLAWAHIDFHSDCFQFFQPTTQTQENYTNIYMQNFHCSGITIQPVLPQPTTVATAGSFSTVGTAFSMYPLFVSSVSAFSGGQTTITWSNINTPFLGTTIPTNQRVYINGGVLSGTSFPVVSQNNTLHTTTVTGDATALVATTPAQLGHNMVVDDYVQLGTSGGSEGKNVSVINSPTTATLREAFSGGSLTNNTWRRARSANNVAFVGSVLDRYNFQNGDFGQVGDAAQNWVFLQTTWPTSTLLFVAQNTLILDNFTFIDSILSSVDITPFAGSLATGSYWPFSNTQILTSSGSFVPCQTANIPPPSTACGTDMSIGAVTFGLDSPVAIDLFGNDGNGTISAVTVGASVQSGVYSITLTDGNGTYTGVTHFTIKRPDGTMMTTGTVGTPYTSSEVNFTITAGATAFNYFDVFAIYVPSNYRPLSGLGKLAIGNTATGRALYGWQLDGTPMPSIGSALIGAQQP